MKTNLTATGRKQWRSFMNGYQGCGAWGLDLVNTIEYPDGPRVYPLKNYEQFLGWCDSIKLIDNDYFNELYLEGYCYVHDAEIVHKQVLNVREILHELILSVATGREAHETYMHQFNKLVDMASVNLLYSSNSNGIYKEWVNVVEDLATPLYMLILDTADMLTSLYAQRIKKCDGCNAFFIDTTKNGTRRWCSATLCGSRYKTGRYYRKPSSLSPL
jgi:predicted RNA-binding Zn ribbon-like protein